MCKVYNEVGCLTTIKSHLRSNGIEESLSLNDLVNFKNNYSITRQTIVLKHQYLIEEERLALNEKIPSLEHSINVIETEVKQKLSSLLNGLNSRLKSLPATRTNIIQVFVAFIKKAIIKLQIWHNKISFDSKVAKALNPLTREYNNASNRYGYINSSFENAVEESGSAELGEIDKKKRLVDEVDNSIYGAIGEQKVVSELRKLSDEYILINDFNCTFEPPIYDSGENNYIKTVQIDHILVSPAGVFLIETKNWSRESINNRSLYSPVQQVRRAGTALYKILNNKIKSSNFMLDKHHWGERKIPVKNLIVLINHKPIEEFQHVKILTLNRLISYVNYFEPSFSVPEINRIADYLLNCQ